MSILDGHSGELAEIYAKVQTSVFLSHHRHWGGPGIVGGPDDSFGEHLLYLVSFFLLESRVFGDSKVSGWVALCLDCMFKNRAMSDGV